MPLLALGHKMALSLLTLMLGGALTTKPRATKRDATAMIRSLGFGRDRIAGPQPVDSAAVKLIKRGPKYDILKNRCSGVSGAIDEALVALERNGYIALPADYSRPNAAWDTLDDIENRGVPEHMALLLAQNGPKPTRKKAMRKFWPTYEKLGGQKQKLLDCVNGQLLLLAGRGELAQSQTGYGGVKVAVNAFSGSRNADPALKQAGYGIVVNTEIESEVEMGPHMDNAETPQDEKYDMSTTRIASGKDGQFFNEICKLNWVHNLGVSLALILFLAAGFPCRTYAMVDCNIRMQWLRTEVDSSGQSCAHSYADLCRRNGQAAH